MVLVVVKLHTSLLEFYSICVIFSELQKDFYVYCGYILHSKEIFMILREPDLAFLCFIRVEEGKLYVGVP